MIGTPLYLIVGK